MAQNQEQQKETNSIYMVAIMIITFPLFILSVLLRICSDILLMPAAFMSELPKALGIGDYIANTKRKE